MQPRYHTQIPSIKGKFYKDIRDIFFGKTKKMLRTLFFHLSDAHSLCNRIELSEPRDGSRAQNPQHVKRGHYAPINGLPQDGGGGQPTGI